MLLINFSHPMTEPQRQAIVERLGTPLERVLEVRTQFDPQRSFMEQTRELFEEADLEGIGWQTTPLLVRLPSLESIAACVLAELHGRMGYFPTIVRLRPVAGSVSREFEFAELIGLQELRDEARARR